MKGDDECPAWTNVSKHYRTSDEYRDTMDSTRDFYTQFVLLLGDVVGSENVSYTKAYDAFDLLIMVCAQNASVSDQISAENLDQARYLAHEWEWSKGFQRFRAFSENPL